MLTLALAAATAAGEFDVPEQVPAQEPGIEDVEVGPADDAAVGAIDVHRVLGFVAVGAWTEALIIGAASGNLGKLTRPETCCDDSRAQPARNIDRVLVNTGNVAYLTAAGIAIYSLLSDDAPRDTHRVHRWLAIAHGLVFLVSATSGVIMATSDTDPRRFASAARVHVAANVTLVPLLAVAMSNILFED